MQTKEIYFKNKKYLIDISLIEGLKKFDVEITDEYLEYIFNKRSLFNFELTDKFLNLLICFDFCNRILYSKNKNFGRIVAISNCEIKYYDDFTNAFLDNQNEKEVFYNFEYFYKQNLNKNLNNVFFGINVHPYYSNCFVKVINDLAKETLSWGNSQRAIKEFNTYKSRYKNEYTFDFFKRQHIIFLTFTLGYRIYCCNKNEELFRRNYSLYKDKYDEYLSKILRRYSINNKTVFEEVNNLEKYNKVGGIYILCLKQKCLFYIGQTRISLKKRILDHFRLPQSDFDKSLMYSDVKKIYVLRVQNKFLNMVEEDCIANINSKLLANFFAGGQSISIISSKDYNSKNHLINPYVLTTVINEAYKFQIDACNKH